MALEDFFEDQDHDLEDIENLATAIRDDELDAEIEAELRDRLAGWEVTRLEDPLLAHDTPMEAFASFNTLLDVLGLERLPAPEPRQLEATEDIEAEVVDESVIEAAEELRRIAQNLSEVRLRQLVRALDEGAPEEAPGEAQVHVRALDAEMREQLHGELQSALDARVEGHIDEAEDQRTRADQFPRIQEATKAGGGRDLAYWQGVLQELRGEREADTLPADELRELQREEAVLQGFIERVEGHIERLSGGTGADTGADTGTGGVGVDRVTGDTGISLDDLIGASMSEAAHSTVPGRDRHDWLDREDWRASPGRVELEGNFMEWVYEIHGDSHRFESSYFELKPENRHRQIEMDHYARLQVRGERSTVETALDFGLPAEWFDRDEGGGRRV